MRSFEVVVAISRNGQALNCLFREFALSDNFVCEREELFPEFWPPDAVDDQVGGRVDDQQEVREVEHDDGPKAEGWQAWNQKLDGVVMTLKFLTHLSPVVFILNKPVGIRSGTFKFKSRQTLLRLGWNRLYRSK